jgi:muramoyltetrapeptide carboxypeptidase LdcA involved in peptidoglycan recycling
VVAKAEDEEARAKAERRERKRQKKVQQRQEEMLEQAEFMDQDIAMLMGFGGFGSSSKKT